MNSTDNSDYNSAFLIYNGGQPTLSGNNFVNPNVVNELYNYNSAGSEQLNAENNYWGVTTAQEVEDRIYHFIDDFSKQFVDYDPFLTTPNTDAPILPPLSVTRTIVTGNIQLEWSPSLSGDVAGYMVHWGNPTGYSYDNFIDVGTDTTYTLTGVDPTIEVAITAYDNDYDSNETILDNQFNGNLSWYTISRNPASLSSITPNSGLKGETVTAEIIGEYSNFTAGTNTVWLEKNGTTINGTNVTVTSDLLLSAEFDIPTEALSGVYDLMVQNDTDGTLILEDAFTISDPTPNWSIEPADFQYVMSMTVRFYINNVPDDDVNNIVSAWVDGELRGVATFETYGSYCVAYLSVYSNQASGENVEFQAYDNSEGRLYISVEPQSNVTFSDGAVLGSPSSPFHLNANELTPLIMDLHQGWNWVSFNVQQSNMSLGNVLSSISDNAYFIRNQTDMAYCVNGSWSGSLTSIDPKELYLLKMNADDVLIFSGTPVDVSTQISLTEGWNWIGYLPQNNTNVNNALSSIGGNGLNIQGQIDFAQYDGSQWFPDFTMNVGSGYKLQMAVDDNLVYPEVSSRLLSKSKSKQRENDFAPTVNPYDYEFVRKMRLY